jgi:hypothetical protein
MQGLKKGLRKIPQPLFSGREIVGVHGFKGSGVQGYIFVPKLDLGCVFTRKASASSDLIQDLEPNWHLFGKMSIFNEDFGSLNAFFVLNPERRTP